MRIEETDSPRLAKARDKELLILKLRFTQLWDKNFANNDTAVVGRLNRNDFLKRYKMLLDEIGNRKLEHSTSPIDKAAFKKSMSVHKFGIDVTEFEDLTIVSNCIITKADSIDLSTLGKEIKKQGLSIRAAALSNGHDPVALVEESYIPLYDLVLRAKQETVKVEVMKPYPNEHSARLQSPSMTHVRVARTKGGKVQGVTIPESISTVWFITEKDGKEVPIPQALRFPTKSWTESKAKKWLVDNDITSIKFEPATKVKKTMWSANYIKKLPDTAFLHTELIKNDAIDAEGDSKKVRCFPYRGIDGKVDVTHLEKAIMIISQSTSLTESIKKELQAKAESILDDERTGKVFEKFVSVYPIDKAAKDERLVCGIVYEPNVKDTQGDSANEVEIRKAAYQFMEEVQSFKVNHEGSKVKVRVLESYIAPTDFTVAKMPIKKGSWVLTVRVLDKKVWDAVKDGELTGFSMAGYAKVAS